MAHLSNQFSNSLYMKTYAPSVVMVIATPEQVKLSLSLLMMFEESSLEVSDLREKQSGTTFFLPEIWIGVNLYAIVLIF